MCARYTRNEISAGLPNTFAFDLTMGKWSMCE